MAAPAEAGAGDAFLVSEQFFLRVSSSPWRKKRKSERDRRSKKRKSLKEAQSKGDAEAR